MPQSDHDSTADLIAQFKTAQCQLSELINEDRDELFGPFEQRTAQLFSLIERRKPADVVEFRAIAHFYLDLLEDGDGGYNKHLFDCLRELIGGHSEHSQS